MAKKKRGLQRQNLHGEKKIGVYNVKINVKKKNIGVYNVKIYVKKKTRGLQRQNLRGEKKRGLQRQNLREEKKHRGLQRQNLRDEKKIGVYNIKIYVKKGNFKFTTSPTTSTRTAYVRIHRKGQI